ncbi:MAG: type II toxin-antitoxin system prevent-host-death family antitoxin [Coriobacteriales bacterium]|jgi:prevent-host-death family protein|nr:type II toxin-antitoxin system prevent-host-death family antitoxin [Coriobacteriales bacterium]
MPTIKPVSDLRNYNDVLREVSLGQPVFLTRNGRGRYAILELEDYDRTQAALTLLGELAKGEQSAHDNGWLMPDAVEEALGI